MHTPLDAHRVTAVFWQLMAGIQASPGRLGNCLKLLQRLHTSNRQQGLKLTPWQAASVNQEARGRPASSPADAARPAVLATPQLEAGGASWPPPALQHSSHLRALADSKGLLDESVEQKCECPLPCVAMRKLTRTLLSQLRLRHHSRSQAVRTGSLQLCFTAPIEPRQDCGQLLAWSVQQCCVQPAVCGWTQAGKGRRQPVGVHEVVSCSCMGCHARSSGSKSTVACAWHFAAAGHDQASMQKGSNSPCR